MYFKKVCRKFVLKLENILNKDTLFLFMNAGSGKF
jgi:hypothetical protein